MKSKYIVLAFTAQGPRTEYAGFSLDDAKAAYGAAEMAQVTKQQGTFNADGSMIAGNSYENTVLARKMGGNAGEITPSW